MKRFACFGTVLLATFAPTCLNDRDSLAVEARRLPGLAETVVGRFERNPPLYYQMRVDRLKRGKELSLYEYNDLGVALDRLGRDDEAIAVMSQKWAKLVSPMPHDKEDVYTYHANMGTFLVHRWFHNGAKAGAIQEVKQARDHIAKALAINPNAHFGREKAQLQVMEWIIDAKSDPAHAVPLGESVVGSNGETIKGLQGLIVLGAAWESVDIYAAIFTLIKGQGETDHQAFVSYRIQELLASGKRPMVPTPLDQPKVSPAREVIDKKTYAEWRRNAEDYNLNRQGYMLGQLTKGLHPDTDPAFWSGYQETPKPKWPEVPFLQNSTNQFYLFIAGFLGFLVFIGTLYVRAQQRAKLATP